VFTSLVNNFLIENQFFYKKVSLIEKLMGHFIFLRLLLLPCSYFSTPALLMLYDATGGPEYNSARDAGFLLLCLDSSCPQ